MRKDWTRSDLEALAALLAEGATFGEIGRRLRRSRNAIAGKVFRLGYHSPPVVVVVPAPRPPSPPRDGVSLADLDASSCRWPTGDDRYCGRDRRAGTPYCASHCLIAYKRTGTP